MQGRSRTRRRVIRQLAQAACRPCLGVCPCTTCSLWTQAAPRGTDGFRICSRSAVCFMQAFLLAVIVTSAEGPTIATQVHAYRRPVQSRAQPVLPQRKPSLIWLQRALMWSSRKGVWSLQTELAAPCVGFGTLLCCTCCCDKNERCGVTRVERIAGFNV
jgi:hypothetical protein